ncbi:MAG TPA: TIGR03087 family PEP-CTERM/XrtA system glycosyltransferase [Phycisphaerae bacterium]|nr:TIGR03087 family PEP-CTERM/XrtA system glycosyltransferase [Phycisphaerae bacterium]
MKLLVLTHRLPCPPDRGAKLRAADELRWLTGRHEVWCAGFIDPPKNHRESIATAGSLAELRKRCRDLAAIPLYPMLAGTHAAFNLLVGGTATEAYFTSRRLRSRVMAWADKVKFDAVLAFSSGIAPLALEVPARRRILDFVDLDSRKWAESAPKARWPMNWVYRAESTRLGRREREWMAAFDACVVCNQREADLVTEQRLRPQLHVIETGVPEIGSIDQDEPDRPAKSVPDEPVVGFLGAMDYPPNIEGVRWFADAIWPRISHRRPEARWWIVGRSPGRSVRELDDGRTIRVTGTVPAVEPYLDRMCVTVAPLRLARGVQTKVLTAMAAARPCVVTSCVAEGIGAEPSREILVADDEAAFAEAVTGLLEDRPRAEAIGQAAREFIRRRYQPARGLARLEELLLHGQTVGSHA